MHSSIAALLHTSPRAIARAWACLSRQPVALNTTAFSTALARRFQALSLAPAIRSIIHTHTPEL